LQRNVADERFSTVPQRPVIPAKYRCLPQTLAIVWIVLFLMGKF
jgi:hypothetical protein